MPSEKTYYCEDCGMEFTVPADTPEDQVVCPFCGSSNVKKTEE